MRVLSWNVNGLRACARKGFLDWLNACDASILGVQEVRARAEQLTDDLRAPAGWHVHLHPAERAGYSGVGLYSRMPPDEVHTSLGVERFDCEGRLQLARFGALWVCNGYFPNGSGKERDNSRIPFKLSFYQTVFERLQTLREAGHPVLVMGDFNTAHAPIDLARPKQNEQTSGFCPEERAELDRWLRAGWTDTFRHRVRTGGHYTWWSQRRGVRERNVGWRIDYVLACPTAAGYVDDAFILPDVRGSDHCPVGVRIDDTVVQHRAVA